ncbi:hypothetical protein [Pseudomonas phage vB_PaeP_TUMS_P10]|nr:hypothetical protein [Pseudomonas phage vB_PaeS_TUMS_P6]UNI71949.1 hypothetical protein [Pseudomonas phage vB_PaeP_TUMS_P10]
MKPRLLRTVYRHLYNIRLYNKHTKEDFYGAGRMFEKLTADFSKISRQGVSYDEWKKLDAHVDQLI